MLGVTMYLTRRRSRNLAAGGLAAARLDDGVYLFPAHRDGTAGGAPFLEVAFRGAAESGHPWLTLLTPDEATDLAREASFAEVQVVTSNDLHDRYFAGRTDGLSPVGGEDLVIASVH